MSVLPSNWATTTVGELADSIQYGHTAKSSKTDVGPRFLRITDIQDNNVNWSTVPFCKIPEEQIAKYRLAKGDLLFARTGATVGKSFLIHSEVPDSVFASYLIRVRVTDAVEPRYVYYFFQSSDYWRQISESASGIGQPNVNGKKLAALTLPIAPLPEQRRIVARIEELFSRLDAGVAALRHAKAQLQRYRQSVLAAAVTGQLTQAWREQHPNTEPTEELLERILAERKELWGGKGKYKEPLPVDSLDGRFPAGWQTTNLDSATTILGDGLHGTPEYDPDGDFYFINGNNLSNGRIVFKSNTKRVSEAEFQKHRKPLTENTILVSINGTLGNTAFYDDERVMLGKSACFFNLAPSLNKHFVRTVLQTNQFLNYLHKTATGSTIKNVPLKAMRAFTLGIPPLDEQHQIVAEVEARTTAIDHLEAELDRQITRSNRLRQSTLAFAFEGRL